MDPELGPGALRMARRGISRWLLSPIALITIVDTAGAELSVAAEQEAWREKSRDACPNSRRCPCQRFRSCWAWGAAVVLSRCCLPTGWWLPRMRGFHLPLEGASVIRYRTPDRAADMARSQRVAAWQLAESGIVDVVVPEYPDAAQEPEVLSKGLGHGVDGTGRSHPQ